jgi:hypothetical protein
VLHKIRGICRLPEDSQHLNKDSAARNYVQQTGAAAELLTCILEAEGSNPINLLVIFVYLLEANARVVTAHHSGFGGLGVACWL